MKFTAKTAIITGAAQGIGLSIAEKLAREGLCVIITDVNREKAAEVAERVAATHGSPCYAAGMDVSDNENVQTVIHRFVEEVGAIDILVNNAGICPAAKAIEDITNDEWMRVFNINVVGMVNCANALIPRMKANRFGKMVNMASSSGFTGGISVSPAYSVSKAAVMCLTKSMAKQLSPFNINVNAISPGVIETAMTENLSYDKSMIALRRFGDVGEVADVAAFLASDESAYLTGNTIDINGGLYMR